MHRQFIINLSGDHSFVTMRPSVWLRHKFTFDMPVEHSQSENSAGMAVGRVLVIESKW